MGLFDKRIAYKPFDYPEYYTEGWLKQAQAFWLHTEIPMSGDVKDWNESFPMRWKLFKRLMANDRIGPFTLYKPQNQKECDMTVELIKKSDGGK